MKQKIDFCIYKDGTEEIILRFYPRRSRVHGFNENPPTTWEEVYKVYFCYSILYRTRWDKDDDWHTEQMYAEDFDECSCLDQVAAYLDEILLGTDKESFSAHPFGEGTSWELKKTIGHQEQEYWIFTLFQSYTNKGYRFSLAKDELEGLKNSINYFLKYMLDHSEGI